MNALPLVMIAVVNLSATVESVFERLAAGEYAAAAALLDESAALEPDLFAWNNLHYLRGRLAAEDQDWAGAETAFAAVPARSILYPMSIWHRARAAFADGRTDDGLRLYGQLPRGFPQSLRLRLAQLAPEAAAARIYADLSGREVEWRRAALAQDEPAMWRLLERNGGDDFALEIARRLDAAADRTPRQRMLLAKTFQTQRIFDRAAPLYSTLLEDPQLGPEAHYELGRTYFQLNRYDEAIAIFRAMALRFPDTSWERNAESQIATAYWRKLDFETAAAAYRALIEKYGADRTLYHGAVRDLVDIYRSLGRNDEARAWIERALASRPSASDRPVLLFTQAKIDFSEGRYAEAAAGFRQVAGLQLRDVPNGTTQTEARYLEALSLDRLGRAEEARALWRRLAQTPFSYYGLKAVARLNDAALPAAALAATVGRALERTGPEFCESPDARMVRTVAENRRLERTRGFLTAPGERDLVSELIFLRLWDEAFFWASNASVRWTDQALADLSFLASRHRQAILYADRLRPANDGQLFRFDADYDAETAALLEMLYPRGYGDIMCREAAAADADPLWLHAITWQESRYDPDARSLASARGLMQFIPETAAEVAARLGLDAPAGALYDPSFVIRLGAHYWAGLMQEFGHPEMALAAYNGGPHNVRRWLAKHPEDDVELFVADIGFVQTKDYVQRVFAHYFKYAHLAEVGR